MPLPKPKKGERVPGSGRKKGVPNRQTLTVIQKAEELGIDPFKILLYFAAGDWKKLGYESEKYVVSSSDQGFVEKWTIEPAVRAKSAQEACSYLYPKRKAVELSNEQGEGFKIVLEDYRTKK